VVSSALADGVLVVVRWGRTARAEVREAVAMLEQVQAPVLGSVLNGRRLTRAERRRYSSSPAGPAPAAAAQAWPAG
jgi:Mrp family chromosome partitioning ATPase